ncbi:MAG: DnaJ domain-containing protein, partial [Gammaproteobacteria bacterium]|nr:DnaJ domain-containing protein [Gammaproteobacteria bacterium]
MDYKDYYKVMGVARDVSPDELRRAYRKLARKYHPDVSKEADAENRFKEVAEAYEVLKDPDKRKAYDELGDQWQAGQDFRPPPGYERQHDFHASNFSREDAAQFSEFFESLFGGRQPFGQQARNASFRARGQDIHAQIRIPLETAFHGVERMITLQVPEAEEGGRVALHNRTLNVKIPKGVQSGQQIRLAG